MVKLQVTVLTMVLATTSAWLDQAASGNSGSIAGISSQQGGLQGGGQQGGGLQGGGQQGGGHAYSYVHFSGPVVGPAHPVIVEKKVVPHSHAVHGAHASHHAAHNVAVPAHHTVSVPVHHSAHHVPVHHTVHHIPVHHKPHHAANHVAVPVHHSAHHIAVPVHHATQGAAVSAQHIVKSFHTAHHTVHHVVPVIQGVHKIAHQHIVPAVHHTAHHPVHHVAHHGIHEVHPVSHGHHGAVLGHVTVAQPVSQGIHHATQGTQAAHGVAIDYVAHPKYEFAYGVTDHKTGDNHNQKESRDGDVVVGEYSLQEPGGNVRTVKYVADKDGFHAHVINSNGNNHSGAHHGTQ